jgi:FkbH-like protein
VSEPQTITLDDEVRRLLDEALASPARLDKAIGALAHLSPEVALRMLVAHTPELRAALSRTGLAALLAETVTATLALRERPIHALAALLVCGADDLSAETAAALAGALPPEQWDGPVAAALGHILSREPRSAPLLRILADRAVSANDAVTAHTLLTRLGQADRTPGTVGHVLRRRQAIAPVSAPPVRVALLSSFTIDPLVPYLDLEARALGLDPIIRVAPFNSWTQEMLVPGGGLGAFEPEIAFLAAALDDLVPELTGAPSPESLAVAGAAAIERVLFAAERFRSWSGAPLVIHAFYTVHADPRGVLDGLADRGRGEWVAELNARLAAGLRALPRSYLLDLPQLLLRRSGGRLENPKMRHLASMRLGEQVLGDLASAYAQYLAPLKGLTRKVVVLDLDNTLWGGVVGEDGPTGIRLGATAPGSEYQEFQRYLLTLTERGILLAINSKNNADDALEVIRGHDGMVLRESHFSAVRINWLPKSENLVSIAEELGLGLDSFVFLDDNPHEREHVRQTLPQVLVPELPADPALYRGIIEALPQLQTLAVTVEDRTRVEQYHSKRQRDQLRDGVETIDAYLHSLGIEIDIRATSEESLPRVHQLFQRTNQFNLTARRYDLAQLRERAASADWRLYELRARDRFGDHGLVATALVGVDLNEWTVDSFLMSCRVIGYGVETALLSVISTDAIAAGAAVVVGEQIQTRKNAPARDFYERHGFAPPEANDGTERWRRSLEAGAITWPAWLTRRDTNDA